MNVKKELEEIKRKFQLKKVENVETNKLRENLEEIRKKLENLYLKIDDFQIRLKELEEDIIKIKNFEISRIEKKYEKIEEFSDKLNESIKQTQNLLIEVNKLKNELKNTNEFKEFLSKQIKNLENLRNDIEKKINKIEKEEIELFEKEIKDIQNKLSFLNINELEKKFSWLENVLLQQEKKLKEIFEKVKYYEEFEKNIATLREDLKILKEYTEKNVKPYLDKYLTLISKIENGPNLEEITSQIKDINIELNKLKDLIRKNEKIETLKEKELFDRFEEKINSILVSIREIKSERIPEFNKIVEDIKSNFKNIYDENVKLNKKIKEIEEKIEFFSSSLNSLKDKENLEIKKVFDTFDKKISNLNKISSDYENLFKDVVEVKRKIDELEKIVKVENKKNELDESIGHKLALLEGKIEKVNYIEKDIENIKERIEELKRSVEREIKDFSFEIWKMRKNLNDFKNMSKEFSTSKTSLESVYREIEMLKSVQEKQEKYYYSIIGILEEILNKLDVNKTSKDDIEKKKIIVR